MSAPQFSFTLEQQDDYAFLVERIIGMFEEYCVVTQSVQTGFPVGVTVYDGTGAKLK